jgi:hypothetical protein
MAHRCCANCIYSYWSLSMKLSGFTPGFPCGPLCANHPDTPGQLRRVSSGGVCRNYRPKPAATEGDIKRIPVSDGQYALVDAADHEWLSRHHWHLWNGYAARQEKHKTIYMHREIMQPAEGMVVDHANRNKLDNCRSNLRVCTRQENMCNRGKDAGPSSRFKGVGYSKEHRKWRARIWFESQRIWLGYFVDEIEAARAYDRKAVELFGEFARLNFPEEWTPQQRQQVYADAQPLRDALKAKAAQAKAENSKGGKGKVKRQKGKAPRLAPRRRHTRHGNVRSTRRSRRMGLAPPISSLEPQRAPRTQRRPPDTDSHGWTRISGKAG